MSIRLDAIPALDGQTDGQTDRIGKTISRSACTAVDFHELFLNKTRRFETYCNSNKTQTRGNIVRTLAVVSGTFGQGTDSDVIKWASSWRRCATSIRAVSAA